VNVKPEGGKRIEALAFSNDSKSVHTIRAAGALQSADAFTGSELSSTSVDFTSKPIRPAVIAAFSGDVGKLATVNQTDSRTVNIISMKDQQIIHRLKHQADVKSLALSKDGKRLVTSAPALLAERYREITIWETQSGKPICTVKCDPFVEERAYGPVAINSTGTLIAHEEYLPAGGSNGLERACEIVVRDAASGELVHRLPGTLPRTERIIFNHDSSLLALSCEKMGVVIYDLAHKKWLHQEPLQGSSNRTSLETFWDLAFSPDGQRLAAVNRVHVLLWDINSGQMVLTLRGAAPPSGDNGFNPRVAWSPDGRRLAASNSDASFSIWDAGERQSAGAKQAMQEAAMMRVGGQ